MCLPNSAKKTNFRQPSTIICVQMMIGQWRRQNGINFSEERNVLLRDNTFVRFYYVSVYKKETQ